MDLFMVSRPTPNIRCGMSLIQFDSNFLQIAINRRGLNDTIFRIDDPFKQTMGLNCRNHKSITLLNIIESLGTGVSNEQCEIHPREPHDLLYGRLIATMKCQSRSKYYHSPTRTKNGNDSCQTMHSKTTTRRQFFRSKVPVFDRNRSAIQLLQFLLQFTRFISF